MNGLCLSAGKLGHTLCRAPCRGCKLGLKPAVFEKLYNGVECCGLAGTRTAGQHQNSAFKCLGYRFALKLLEFYSELTFHIIDLKRIGCYAAVDIPLYRKQPRRNMLLRRVISGNGKIICSRYAFFLYSEAFDQPVARAFRRVIRTPKQAAGNL